MGWWLAPWYDKCLADAERHGLADARRSLLADLQGTVVEVGAGTGLNLRWYPDAVTRLVLVEPDPGMRKQLRRKVEASGREGVEIVDAPGERLPLDDGEADAAVGTLVLCTIPDPRAAAREVHRVLRPGGTWRFYEHVGHEPGWDRRLQRLVEPVWKRVAGGCHLTRDAVDVITGAGFEIRELRRTELPHAPRFARPAVQGTALRR